MAKHSTATVRRVPAAGGGLIVHADSLTFQTNERIELQDITDRVASIARVSGVREGTLSLWSLHTTCAVFVNESQKALHADIKRFLETIVARDADWMHNDPVHSDCDRLNADSHLRTMLLGQSVTLQISGGEIVLGQWQRVLLGELDGPRARTIRAQVMGIS